MMTKEPWKLITTFTKGRMVELVLDVVYQEIQLYQMSPDHPYPDTFPTDFEGDGFDALDIWRKDHHPPGVARRDLFDEADWNALPLRTRELLLEEIERMPEQHGPALFLSGTADSAHF